MSKDIITLGVPELTEDQLIEIINYIEDSIRKYVFSQVDAKFIDDFNIEIVLDKKEELNLMIDIELTFFKIKIPNADDIVNKSLEIGRIALEKKIDSLKS